MDDIVRSINHLIDDLHFGDISRNDTIDRLEDIRYSCEDVDK